MTTRGALPGRSRASHTRARALLSIAFATLAAIAVLRPARAQDAAAVGRITLLNRKALEAYQHLEFDSALGILNEALEQSERAGLTQHPIRARTFVTMGIVTMGGFKQREQAVKYFRKALQIQPEVRLSAGLANPEIQAAFDEAIATLGSAGSDELPPEKALVHEPVRSGQSGKPVPIVVVPDKDLEASAVVLRYRPASAAAFTDLRMEKRPTGAFEATIPASATEGDRIAYCIEARRSNGSILVGRGSAADPIVVALTRPLPAVIDMAPTEPPARAASEKRLYLAVLGGTGLGWASGTGEATGNETTSSALGWSGAGQLAPEIGYFLSPRLMLGLQARLQMVRGATPYHVPNPEPGECGDDNVCDPPGGAFAGLLKVTWFLADPRRAFQPYLAFSAGGGTIRHVSAVSSPAACGSGGTEPCKDTVPGGPALFGPGVGFRYVISDGFGIVAGIGALVGAPKMTAAADVNLGVAFQL